jgi:hypothetical protein
MPTIGGRLRLVGPYDLNVRRKIARGRPRISVLAMNVLPAAGVAHHLGHTVKRPKPSLFAGWLPAALARNAESPATTGRSRRRSGDRAAEQRAAGHAGRHVQQPPACVPQRTRRAGLGDAG